MEPSPQEENAEKRRKRVAELDDRAWEAALAAVPDIAELLELLKDAVPGIDVLLRLTQTSPDDRPWLSIDVRHGAQLRQLADVLRRGLEAGSRGSV